MKGGGYYSLATKGAKDVIDRATPLVLDAIERIGSGQDGQAFTIADMGCADGGTSIGMLRAAVSAFQAKDRHRPILIVYTDQTRNDYNALFQNVLSIDGKDGALDDLDAVHVVASATSFYRQMLPRQSLHLGFSATAMHWLSSKPCDISGHVQAVGAEDTQLAAFAEQGRKDWERILLHRAAELVPEGRLVLVNFCKDEAGRYLGHTGGISMFETFNRLWRSFVEEGVIGSAEYEAITLPQYYKTVGEFSAPLEDPENPVYRAALRLESIETRVTPCPFAAEFKQHGDPARFAKSYIPTLRSWTESTFYAGLDGGRPAGDRAAIIDRYYQSYEDLVRLSPDGHAMDYVHAFMVVRKGG